MLDENSRRSNSIRNNEQQGQQSMETRGLDNDGCNTSVIAAISVTKSLRDPVSEKE
jgi:hypothetical protein